YLTRDAARSDVFDYIEMFYNPKRRHGSNGGVSPVEFERQAGLWTVPSFKTLSSLTPRPVRRPRD
ncbi:IS3 family transposase, partial [Pseudoxanthomonas winnipegensis]|uniref:IS3 family transposase n=1 Tax=Pseudoxanthomonas winnipegensis TaxID=2480810 RepID=UPI001F1E1B70